MELKGGTRFAKETDEIYRQFAEAMKTGDADLKEEALRRLAESNKAGGILKICGIIFCSWLILLMGFQN